MASNGSANGGVRDHLLRDPVNPVPRRTDLIEKEVEGIKLYKTPYESYWITTNGEVWSDKRKRFIRQFSAPNKGKNPKDYRKAYLYNGQGRSIVRVHRLMMETFYGKCPSGYVVDHIDGDPTNNRLDNLRYLTSADNTRTADYSNRQFFHKKVVVHENEEMLVFESVSDFVVKYGLSRRQSKPHNYRIGKRFGNSGLILEDFVIGDRMNEIWLRKV